MWERLKQIIWEEKGMTLVEIMVSLVIGSMIVITAGSVLIFSGNLTTHIGMKGNGGFLTDQVLQLVEGNLVYATYVHISMDASPSDAVSYNHLLQFKSDGMVYLDGDNIYGETYYQEKRIAAIIRKENLDKDILSLEIQLEEPDKELKILYSGSITVKLANLELGADRKIRYVFPIGCDTMDSRETDIYIFYRLEE